MSWTCPCCGRSASRLYAVRLNAGRLPWRSIWWACVLVWAIATLAVAVTDPTAAAPAPWPRAL